MRAYQIMTRNAITVLPETPILEAAHKMLENHVSGLPVLDASGRLVGVVSEGDFLRRSEIGTQQKRPRWLQHFLSPRRSANYFIQERGRKVEDVMTRDPVVAEEDTSLDELIHLMEKNGIKRLPVLRDDKLVGIITRANLLQAVASMAKEIPDPTADDEHIRDDGSLNAQLRGSTGAEGLPKTGRTSIARRSHSCASPQSASCYENFAIPLDVPGQTLRLPQLVHAPAAAHWQSTSIDSLVVLRHRETEWRKPKRRVTSKVAINDTFQS